ncbi:hypothetical protein SH1V18_03710 [Vallitalea longa]|uniref:HTH cro/C1-type domain-containing protein n=1 Tax=Vallitalea longa TaxID=2936439 RepID=A0A9W5Y8D5_9FIRM|nr:helix-turn-helix transcriptional regulator [Vallitalea longa]GKX27891.1 hypothetical protein SH1V18_03710 [Vallitalea longa]
MKKIKIGEVIYQLRKEKSMTQEQLANFIGVSTAAISKWESGNSYPDITLLPVLATFFNITIDYLLNYRVRVSEEKVKEIYFECNELFNNSDFDVAVDRTNDYLKKYSLSYF